MNPTKAMLLREMAMAEDLDTFFAAYKALENLNRLVAQLVPQQQPQQPQQAQPQQSPYPRPFVQPAPPPTPQTPPPFSQSEPSWDEPSERMPWEEQ